MNPLLTPVSPKKSRRIIIHAVTLALSFTLTIILLENQGLHRAIQFSTERTFIVAAIVAGFFYASTLTVAPATAALFLLGADHPPLLVAALAALGSVFGDALILRFIKDELVEDLHTLTGPLVPKALHRLLTSRILHWPLTLLAAALIASPLPDELGITVLTLIKFRTSRFYLLSFTLNFLGILTITFLGGLF